MPSKNGVTYFWRGAGATIVWDPAKNKVLAAACPVTGLFAVTDPKVIKTLAAMGYARANLASIKAMGIGEAQLPEPNLKQYPPKTRFLKEEG